VLRKVICEPSSENDECEQCADSDLDEPYCISTGYKREVRCAFSSAMNFSDADAYITFQSCTPPPSDFATFVKFEVLMFLLFSLSLSIVTRRKHRLHALQHHRIQQYLA